MHLFVAESLSKMNSRDLLRRVLVRGVPQALYELPQLCDRDTPGIGRRLIAVPRPQPLVSVAASRPDQPFTVIVLLDTLEMEKPAAVVARDSVERFLRSNGGHLDEAVGIYALKRFGIRARRSAVE